VRKLGRSDSKRAIPPSHIANNLPLVAPLLALAHRRFYAITTQVVGAVAFGFIIATVTIIIETLDPGASAKRRRKDELVDYLNERGYSRDLQKRARKHFAYFQNKTSAFAEMHIVGELSHTLREVLLFESRNYTIPNIKLFRFEVSDQFITEVRPERSDSKSVIPSS